MTKRRVTRISMDDSISRNISEPIILPWPYDEEVFIIQMHRYLSRFADNPEQIISALTEAKMRAGVL
jgi:hypothetical protein